MITLPISRRRESPRDVASRPETSIANGLSSSKESFHLGYRPELDALRGIAILIVMAMHVTPWQLMGGFIGVEIFFVLSGFLITILLLQEWGRNQSISLKHFYFRRGLRLLPALVVMLLVCWLYARAFLSREEARTQGQDALSILFYYYNWKIAFLNSFSRHLTLGHAWSLSVEEQFYLLWPLVLVAFLKLKLHCRWLIGVVLLGIMASACWRTTEWNQYGFFRAYMCTDTRTDGLLTGCLAGMLVVWDWLPKSRWAKAILRVAALVALAALAWHCTEANAFAGGYMYYGGFTIVSLAVAIILLAVIQGPPQFLSWLFACPPLIWIGRISYGLYLWHWPIFVWLKPLVDPQNVKLWVLIQFAAAVAMAALSFYCLERPFLRLKARSDQKNPMTFDRATVKFDPANKLAA